MESVSNGDTTAKVEMPHGATIATPAAASAYAEVVRAAGGVVLNLFGAIGPDKSLSLANVKSQLTGYRPRYIHLNINSTGGNIAEANRIYNFLRNQPAQMSAEIGRHCESAAVTLLLAAAYRMAAVDSNILIHATRIPVDSIKCVELTARDLRERAEMLERDDNEAIDTMCERTGYCRAWFEKQFQDENSLEIWEALESGLVHEIGGLSMQCDPRWIEQVRLTPRNVFWPRRYLTTNYLAACRTALPRGAAASKEITPQ